MERARLRCHARGPQAVTALAFAEGGRVLVSAGGDTLAAAWQLLDLLAAPAAQEPPAPLFSWRAGAPPPSPMVVNTEAGRVLAGGPGKQLLVPFTSDKRDMPAWHDHRRSAYMRLLSLNL
jgi:hypothetical protein